MCLRACTRLFPFRATCGQLPPNCDKGHGFIHDPNVAGVPEVKGQIRLLFRTGVTHQSVCATRTFQLTNTRTKAGLKSTFKALENLIRFKDRDGDNNRGNRRCNDMDTAIPALMGVPRPILEHVIFCHQEDSNWPLGERILLKKRFDEIFGSSRYTKALEAIDKQRKEITKEAKEKAHVLALISKDRDSVIQLRVERDRVQQAHDSVSLRMQSLSAQVERKESELSSVQNLESEFREKLIRIETLDRELAKLNLDLSATSTPQECEQQLSVVTIQLSNLDNEKKSITEKIISTKSNFENLVRDRNSLTAQLKSARNSQLEASNIHDLIRLKLSELQDAVSSAKSAAFLPPDFSFHFDQPAVSIHAMERLVTAQVSMNEAGLAAFIQRETEASSDLTDAESRLAVSRQSEMKLVSDLSVAESQLSSCTSELSSIDQRCMTLLAPLGLTIVSGLEAAIGALSAKATALDLELKSLQTEKRILQAKNSESLDDLRSEIAEMISDSVTNAALMHATPVEILEFLNSRKSVLADKLDSVLSTVSMCGTCPTSQKTQLQSDLESTAEELATAKQALKIYSQMKSKSVQELKCGLCRQKIVSSAEFENNVEKLTKRLPDIIAESEAKLNSLTHTNRDGDLKRFFLDIVAVETQMARITGLGDVIARIDQRRHPVAGGEDLEERLVLIDSEETEKIDAKNSISLQIQSLENSFELRSHLVTRIAHLDGVLVDIRARLLLAQTEGERISNLVLGERTKQNEAQNATREHKQMMDSQVNLMRNAFQQIFQITSQVEDLKSRNTDPVQTNLADLETRDTEIANQLNVVMETLSSLDNQKSALEAELKQCTEQADHWKRQVEGSVLTNQLTQLKAEMATVSVAPDQIRSRIVSLSDEVKIVRDERAKLSGESAQLTLQIGEVDKKLNSTALSGVDEKYRQAFCVMENHNVVSKDVQRYHQALDRALMSYHVQKMNQINELIRDLWGRIYKGTDIDFIAIRSDSESDEAEGGVSTAKRSYNYRVVMGKGDVELEMRGRCSAGQKVLASLIIRLALAESFCLSCGILALDEPTTNLDRSNIGGLAEALAELIASRREQRNFQLVIITHDESFVRMLGRLRACDNFYRVGKDDYGYSTISRAAIYDLHA